MKKFAIAFLLLATMAVASPLWASQRGHQSQIDYLVANPIGGTEASHGKVRQWMVSEGFRPQGHLPARTAITTVFTPVTPAGGEREMSAFDIVMICVGGGILAALIVFGCIFAGQRGGRRFLADPNHEMAKAANSPQNVGEREIVSATAAGDYHRETVVSEEVGVARELSRRESLDRVYALFASRQPAVVNNYTYPTTVVERVKEVSAPATEKKPEETDEAKKKAAAEAKQKADDEAKKKAGGAAAAPKKI